MLVEEKSPVRTGLIVLLAFALLAGAVIFVSTRTANSPGTLAVSGNGATSVEAPGTSVQSDETGTRVQAPGVDITVPAAKDRDPD